jgi:hypothetical protein
MGHVKKENELTIILIFYVLLYLSFASKIDLTLICLLIIKKIK